MVFIKANKFFFLEWIDSTGWCLDANGGQPGRKERQYEIRQNPVTEDSCFAQCDNDVNDILKGCEYYETESICVRYTGQIVKGSGPAGDGINHKCHHRGNKQIIVKYNWKSRSYIFYLCTLVWIYNY